MQKVFFINLIFFCINVLFPSKAFSCIGSDCKPCPNDFSLVFQCCSLDNNNCVVLNDEIENCGIGRWAEYTETVSVHFYSRMVCCEDSTENSCISIPNTNDDCGKGEFKGYPYSPIKKCCKDSTQSECAIISSKRRCGEYQLKEYPLQTRKCCNSTFSECIEAKDCPRCR